MSFDKTIQFARDRFLHRNVKCAHCGDGYSQRKWTLQAYADGRKKRTKYLCDTCDIRLNKFVLNYFKDVKASEKSLAYARKLAKERKL